MQKQTRTKFWAKNFQGKKNLVQKSFLSEKNYVQNLFGGKSVFKAKNKFMDEKFPIGATTEKC